MTTIITAVALLYLFFWYFRDGNRTLLGAELFSSEAVLGKVGDLPYVTFFSFKNPERPSSPEGWWSVVLDHGSKPVVVPGRIMSSPGKLLYVERWGMVRVGVDAQNWYFSGLLEGFVLSSDIRDTLEMVKQYYGRISAAWQGIMGQKLAKFEELRAFVATQVNRAQSLKDAPHLNMTDVLNHMQGMVDGYNMRFAVKIESNKQTAISLADLFLLNSISELIDLGAYVNHEAVNFGSPSTEFGKRHGTWISLLSAMLVSGRASASLMELSNPSEATNYPNIQISWANQLWYSKSMRRIFSRISIASDATHGYQFIGFPGQTISIDSFSMNLGKNNQFASVVMRQLDFRASTFESRPTPPLSAWMLVSAAYHMSNITYTQYMDMWNHSRPHLLAQEWKTICVSNSQVNVLQSLIDELLSYQATASLLQDKFMFEEPSMTHATGQSLKKSNFQFVEHNVDSKTRLQSTQIDTHNHASLWNAIKHEHQETTAMLSGTTRKDIEAARDEVAESYALYLESGVEYVELSDLN
jgi:hypothetical protein